MRDRVRDVLMVSSLYDYFILSQDGRLNEQFLGEFLELNLRYTPNLTHVFHGEDALELARDTGRYNLIITSTELGDMNVVELAHRLRENGIDTPLVLLAYDPQALNEFSAKHNLSEIERTFLWQGDVRILLAITKYIEDKMNVAYDTGVAGVQAIIVIEDNIRYYSSFMPMIYTELVKHSQSLVPEGINLTHKLMRIRARPKLLLCDHYEEAWSYFETYSSEILGIISDIKFPKDGESCPDAGVRFAREARKIRPDVPIMLQSSRPENEEEARSVNASFGLKGSRRLLDQVRNFMVESFRFGPFVFRLQDGTEIARAPDLKTLEQLMYTVPAESLAYHGERNDFSNWLKARTEFALADKLRPRKVSDFATMEDLRQEVIRSIAEYRKERNRGLVADFDRHSFDGSGFYRIGTGSLGGKARGLAFINTLLNEYHVDRDIPNVSISVPLSVVLATDIFDRFLEDNALASFAMSSEDYEQIQIRFVEGDFSQDIRDDLAAFLRIANYPLAVRSSSLLEDSQYQPFAGVYETHMLPNEHSEPGVRLEQLLTTIKRVYASTFSNRAKNFIDATNYRLEEEKMAVIIQRVVGAPAGDRFYPDFAGVARSYNFYPTAPATSEDGIAAVGLGLGKTVVDGGCCVRFSPRYPRHSLQFSSVDEILKNCQREFYAIRLGGDAGDAGDWHECCVDLGSWGLDVAEADGTLAAVGSTYSSENDAVYDGVSRPGVRLVTLAPVLKHGRFPLAGILETLLELGELGTGAPVELEFAVTLRTPPGVDEEFGFLQLRPLALSKEMEDVELDEVDERELVCGSESVLGNGKITDLMDVVVVDYLRFERTQSQDAARIVGQLNRDLRAAARPYLLIGVGRWGSSEPFLGIPVTWAQIAGARVIVEAGFRDLQVTPSQGTHFFQNLTSSNVGYFTVNPEAGQGFLDWEWLSAQKAIFEESHVRHLRFDTPLVVKMNGKQHAGRIYKPAK